MVFFWKEFTGELGGAAGCVPPDSGVPETVPMGTPSWLAVLRTLWLRLFVWRHCVLWRVPRHLAREGYHVGYAPRGGPPMITIFRKRGAHFRMLLGFEACGFFVVDKHGTAHALELVTAMARKDHLTHRSFPLY